MNAPLVIGCIAGPALTLLSLVAGLVITTIKEMRNPL